MFVSLLVVYSECRDTDSNQLYPGRAEGGPAHGCNYPESGRYSGGMIHYTIGQNTYFVYVHVYTCMCMCVVYMHV